MAGKRGEMRVNKIYEGITRNLVSEFTGRFKKNSLDKICGIKTRLA